MTQEWESVEFERLRASMADFALESGLEPLAYPRNLALSLACEIGTLCNCLKWRSAEDCLNGLQGFTQEDKSLVGQRLSSVLLCLVRLSDLCGVHLPKAIRAKIKINEAKYPASLVKGSSNKYTAYTHATGYGKGKSPEKTGTKHLAEAGAPWDGTMLSEVMNMLNDFVSEREWDTFHTPRDLCLAMSGEAGEVSECFLWRAEEDCQQGLEGWTLEERDGLAQELSDVTIYTIRMAYICQIDLAAAAHLRVGTYRNQFLSNGHSCSGGGGKGGRLSNSRVVQGLILLALVTPLALIGVSKRR
ncbi:unnamed protein product [Chrysoparadoxa australica]